METALKLLEQSGFANLGLGNWVMFAVGGILIYLAIVKKYEPLLLIPIGFGTILANLPLAEMGSYGEGIIALIYNQGIKTELLPPLIFLGVGVLTDFRPLLGRPLTFLLGAAAQLGIFTAALGAAYLLNFNYRSRVDRDHRWSGWTDIHLFIQSTGAASSRADCCGGLQLHVLSPDHPASYLTGSDDEKGTGR